MSQHDYDISNQAFAATRADLNLALLALASNNSGPTAPATTFAYMWWPDTTTGILKQRNAGNSAWVSILTMSTGLPVGAAAKGANIDITSMNGLTTPLSVAQGGTGTAGGATDKIQAIGASVAASALTITAGVLALDFRSATLTSGTVTSVAGTPASLVVPSTATLGTVSAQQSRLVVLALNNAGTIELAVVNISGGKDLTETGVISTTAISVTADVANVIYSTTARTNVAYRVLGYVESTQATAGTWATAPSTIQGYGGQALAAMSSLGYGADVDVTGSRALNTVYYNTTGRPKKVSGWATNSSAGVIEFQVNSLAQWRLTAATAAPEMPFFAIVQPGKSYQLNNSGSVSINKWVEST